MSKTRTRRGQGSDRLVPGALYLLRADFGNSVGTVLARFIEFVDVAVAEGNTQRVVRVIIYNNQISLPSGELFIQVDRIVYMRRPSSSVLH